MKTVKPAGNRIEIKFDYEARDIAFIKTLPNRKYHAGSQSWSIPMEGSLPFVERLASRGFVVDPDLKEQVEKDQREAEEAIALSVMDDTEFDSPLPLRDYQRVGASFLYQIGSGLLGDDMGLGKTIQSLAVAEKSEAKKVLIFTPSSVKWQWRDEIQKFLTTDRRTVVIHGTPKKRAELWHDDDQRFYVANYEQLLKDFHHMDCREWDLIIADEATKISNPKAQVSKLIKKLRAKRRIAMTGTPISNRANEVWNIIDFSNPGALGNYWGFVARYCTKNQWGGIDGYQNIEELTSRVKRYMIRRLKTDVLKELPDRIVTDVPFPLTAEEKVLYKKIKQEILFEIEHSDISKINNPMTIQYTLVKMLRLRQIADSLELLGQNTKSSKMDVLKDMLPTVLVDGVKVIIFTQFAEMADLLVRDLEEYNPLLISGKVAGTYQETVKKFNEENEHQILVMTSAGQFGLNIQRASVIFHYDQEWSLAKMEQREGRAHRMGQERVVQVFNLLAKGTIDYYIKKVLRDKSVISRTVLGDMKIDMAQIREALKLEV